MKRAKREYLVLMLGATFAATAASDAQAQTPRPNGYAPFSLQYPGTARGTQTDDIDGVRVADPYRWLEAVSSPSVKAWVAAQNNLSERWLSELPERNAIRERVVQAWGYRRLSAPFNAGDRLFFFENTGMESRSVLYVQDRPDVLPRILIDPNVMSKDAQLAIVGYAASPDGRYFAYSVSLAGSSWRSVRIRDVRTSTDLSDTLQGIQDGPLAWTHDARGFFYVRAELPQGAQAGAPILAPAGRRRVYYHRVGRSQSDDRLMFESPDHPEWRLRAQVSDDGQYLIISPRVGTELQNRVYFVDLDNPRRPNLAAPLVKLFDSGDALYDFVANEGPVFYFRTSKGAPRYRLVGVDINTPDPSRWTTIIRETYDPLIAVKRLDDRFVAHRLHDAHSQIELFALDGGVRGTVQLPGIGTATDLRTDSETRELYLTFESFLQAPAIYRYDLETRNLVPYREQRSDTLLSRFETTQLFFTSKNGTRIPMFITARRGLKLDGSQPTLLTAVGSLFESSTPTFSPEIATWLELGGIYAVANVRGGGEFGRAWHDSASSIRKQTAIDDFVAAAEFLINQRYTRPSSLGIVAKGVGGLLAGAAMTQRPELFSAVSIDAGLFDMVRFAKFGFGASMISEFGSPDARSTLEVLLSYSPLSTVRSGKRFPSTLITVGEGDEEIASLHGFKFVAALQAAQTAQNPVLLRVDQGVGDGSPPPTGKAIAATVDRLTFLTHALHAQIASPR